MKDLIPYGKHYIDEEDINSVSEILRHHKLTQGNQVNLFEKEIADYVGAKYAVAVSNWTVGLHMACKSIDLKKGDKFITSPITFLASSNSVLYCGAQPIFADINKETINIDTNTIKRTLDKHEGVKGIMPIHFAGLSCDMEEIHNVATKHNLSIIEDAAHALGARYEDGSMVGSCKYSDITGFSFHPVKSIAAGEGGMITTNNKYIYERLLKLRNHGMTHNADDFLNLDNAYTDEKLNPWYYEMQELGFNYRITDIQCALGRSQLKKLNKFLKKRKSLALSYDLAFKHIPMVDPIHVDYRNLSSHHLYVLRIDFRKLNLSRAEFMIRLRKKGVNSQVHYIPVTSQPYYEKLGYDTNDYPNAQSYYNEALSIPLFYSLKKDDQKKVIESIKEIITSCL